MNSCNSPFVLAFEFSQHDFQDRALAYLSLNLFLVFDVVYVI